MQCMPKKSNHDYSLKIRKLLTTVSSWTKTLKFFSLALLIIAWIEYSNVTLPVTPSLFFLHATVRGKVMILFVLHVELLNFRYLHIGKEK